jgi:hypothetical protein
MPGTQQSDEPKRTERYQRRKKKGIECVIKKEIPAKNKVGQLEEGKAGGYS